MRVWIDLDNTPHVLILRPIINELVKRGVEVELTARDYGQTVGLLKLFGLEATVLGRHPGKEKIKKIFGITVRSIKLAKWAYGRKFDLAFSHGSRAQVLAASLLGIPVWIMYDYEYVFDIPFKKLSEVLLIPEVIPDKRLEELGIPLEKVKKYPGIKEELYVYEFKRNPSIIEKLGADRNKIIAVVRPPATMAHYYREESGMLFNKVMEYLVSKNDVNIILIPRTEEQKRELMRTWRNPAVIFPKEAVDGLNLIWHSDLVIGGGGTMTREAAVLGIPSYSIFRGKLGAVDRFLAEKGRLVIIETPEEVESKLRLKKLENRKPPLTPKQSLKEYIAELIVSRLKK